MGTEARRVVCFGLPWRVWCGLAGQKRWCEGFILTQSVEARVFPFTTSRLLTLLFFSIRKVIVERELMDAMPE